MEQLAHNNILTDPAAVTAMLQELLHKLSQKDFALHLAHQEISHLKEVVRLFKSKQFGPSSEKFTGQPCLFNEAEVEVAVAEEASSPVNGHNRKRPKRRPLPDKLPRIDHIYEIPESERTCECCNVIMKEIGEATSEQLDIVPAIVQVLRHRRKKYGCPVCKTGVRTAKLPPQPLPKTNASAGLLAHIATAKYVDGLPLYRQEEIFKRIGVEMSRSTISRWMIDLAQLLRPIYNSLEEDLLESLVLLMDETRVQVLKGTGKKPTAQSFMWVRYRYGPKPVVLFNFDPSRSAVVARRLLTGFSGHLVTDGYRVYETVASVRGEIVHHGCWDHARRKFDEALKGLKFKEQSIAATGLSLIQALYAVERRVKDKSEKERQRARDLYSRSILAHLERWLNRVNGTVPPKTLTGKALSYLKREWPKLVRYVSTGSVPMSNAMAENAIRPFTIGRKNWLFCDSKYGAEASAILYSVIETAKANGKEPYAYLKHIIAVLPGVKSPDEIDALLPYNL